MQHKESVHVLQGCIIVSWQGLVEISMFNQGFSQALSMSSSDTLIALVQLSVDCTCFDEDARIEQRCCLNLVWMLVYTWKPLCGRGTFEIQSTRCYCRRAIIVARAPSSMQIGHCLVMHMSRLQRKLPMSLRTVW